MNKEENLINSIEKIAKTGYYEYISLKNSINIDKCKKKRDLTSERKSELKKLHEVIEEFVVINHRTGEKIYFLLVGWIGYQLSALLKSVDNYISGVNQFEINEINKVLEKLRLFFKDQKKYKRFTIKKLTEAQNYKLKGLLFELKIELEDWKVHKDLYYEINIKIEYLELLLANQKEIQEIEKKRTDGISRAGNKLEEIINSNKWDFYLTITFNQEKIDRFDIELQFNEIQKWFFNMKTKFPSLKYLILPGRHFGEHSNSITINENGDFAGHFHCLISNIPLTFFQKKEKVLDNGNLEYCYDEKGRQIYFIPELDEKYGNTYLTLCDSDTKGLAIYFKKHINLQSEFHRKLKKRYYSSQNLDKCIKIKSYKTEAEKIEQERKLYEDKSKSVIKTTTKHETASFRQYTEKYKVYNN